MDDGDDGDDVAAPDDEPFDGEGYGGDERSDGDEPSDGEGYGGAVDDTTGLYVNRGYDQVKRARQRYGLAGAALAGAMIGLREVLEKPKDDVAVVVDAPSDPVDLDGNGITVALDGQPTVVAPPQHRPVADAEAAREWTRNVLRRNRRR